MKRLVEWSIAHHHMVLALSVLLAAAGAWTARDMPVDVFPDLTAPTVTILTEGRGMAPDELETLVTFPIEAAMNGASGVRRVRSATAVGIAVVWVEFDWGTDIFQARQVVAEKLALASGSLPPQVERPILAPVSSIMGEILFFAISSDVDDPLTLRTVADTIVRRRLLAVAGVSQVTPIGGAERQFQVIAHPDQLRANNISVTDLLDGVRGASQNTSAGIFMEGPQEYVLQTIGRARTPQEIGDSVIALRGDRPVLVRDIADVREGAALKRGEGSRSGKPAVIIGVQKQPGANTVELTARLDDEIDALQRDLPRGMTIDRRIFRQADFIEVAVNNVVRALRDGGLLVVAIVILFLANFRAAAITLTAIPLSLAAAVLAMRAFDVTINTMTLGGLAIAIGALVDDAIIDVENVVRRLRENAARPAAEQRPIAMVVYQILIDDRIVFSGNFTGAAVRTFLESQGFPGVAGGRYFTNAIDTRTLGLDIIANYGFPIGATSTLRLTGGFNYNVNRVLRVSPTPPELSAFQEILFDRVERARIEVGQPQDNLYLSGVFNHKDFGFTLRTQQFGEVTSFGTPTDGSLDQTFGAKWITDVNASYTFNGRFTLAAGVDNVFDVYPDVNNQGNATTAGNNNFGIFPYNQISPFGFNGAFYYGRITFGF